MKVPWAHQVKLKFSKPYSFGVCEHLAENCSFILEKGHPHWFTRCWIIFLWGEKAFFCNAPLQLLYNSNTPLVSADPSNLAVCHKLQLVPFHIKHRTNTHRTLWKDGSKPLKHFWSSSLIQPWSCAQSLDSNSNLSALFQVLMHPTVQRQEALPPSCRFPSLLVDFWWSPTLSWCQVRFPLHLWYF